MNDFSVESLRETLIDLERSRVQEAEQRLIAETILRGLDIISSDSNSQEMFLHLFEFFRGIIPYEACYFAEVDEAFKTFRCLYHSSGVIEYERSTINDFLISKSNAKRVFNIFDTKLEHGLAVFNSLDKQMLGGSALIVPVHIESTKSILCFLIKERGGFEQKYLALAERFSPILKQALLKINYLERIIVSNRMVALAEMSAGVAHEINNPLAILKGNLKILKVKLNSNAELSNEFTPHIDKATEMVERIAIIVRGMRSVSQNTEGEKSEEVLLSSLIEESLALVTEKIKLANIKVRIEIEDSIAQKKFKIYRVKLSQVLLNILSNAIDAVKNIDGEKLISFQVFETEHKLNIVVVDSGPGVLPNLDHKIFEPFFTTKPPGEGMGLGLSLCLSMVKSMNGQLFLDRHYKETAFHLELPI